MGLAVNVMAGMVFLGFIHRVLAVHFETGTCTFGKHLLTTYGVTLKSCAAECFCYVGCSRLMYDRLVLRCRLFGDVGGVSANCTDFSADMVYLASFYGITNDMCSGTVRYCSEITAPSNAVMFGNRNSVGAKRKLKCHSPYQLNGTATLTCLSDGAWSGHGHCVEACTAPVFGSNVVCQQVIRIAPGGEMITIETPADPIPLAPYLEGSTMILRCFNLNETVVATCSSGHWENLPICDGSVGQYCLVDGDCVAVDAECRSNVCWCMPGLSYDKASLACVSSCGQYGETFQEVDGWALWHHDIECETVATGEDCMALCLSKTAYVCKSMDMGKTSRSCCLRDLVPIETGAEYFKGSSSYIYYQRDCL